MDLIKLSTGLATGSAGSATATGESIPLSGLIYKVRLVFSGSPPSTSDVTLKDLNDPAGELIVNRLNSGADTTLYPRRQVTDPAGTGYTYNGTKPVAEPFPVKGPLQLRLVQSNPGSECTAVIWFIPT